MGYGFMESCIGAAFGLRDNGSRDVIFHDLYESDQKDWINRDALASVFFAVSDLTTSTNRVSW